MPKQVYARGLGRPRARAGARPHAAPRVRRVAGLRALPYAGPLRGLHRPARACPARPPRRPAAGAAPSSTPGPARCVATAACARRWWGSGVPPRSWAAPSPPPRSWPRAATTWSPRCRRGPRSSWRRRGPSRWPRVATPRSWSSTPGSPWPGPTCAPRRRRCGAGAARPDWSRPGASVVVGRRPGPPGRPGAGAVGPRRLRPARAAARAEAHLPPASRLATITGEPGAVDDALTLLDRPPGTEVLGPVEVDDGDSRVVVRVPRAHGSGAVAGAGRGPARALGPQARRGAHPGRPGHACDARALLDSPARVSTARPADGRLDQTSEEFRGHPAHPPVRRPGPAQPALEVVDFDKELRRLVADLTDTMLEAPGAGLAAPQIGVGLRVFTWYVEGEVGHLVNPVLDLSEESQDGPEGCLSIPGLSIDCRRALSVVAKGFDHARRAGRRSRAASCSRGRSSTRPTTSTASSSSTGSTRRAGSWR